MMVVYLVSRILLLKFRCMFHVGRKEKSRLGMRRLEKKFRCNHNHIQKLPSFSSMPSEGHGIFDLNELFVSSVGPLVGMPGFVVTSGLGGVTGKVA